MLTALYVVLALIGVFTMIMYLVLRSKVKSAYRGLALATGNEIATAGQKCWDLDNLQDRFVVASIVNAALLLVLDACCTATQVRSAAMVLGVGSMIVILIFCQMFNVRKIAIRSDQRH